MLKESFVGPNDEADEKIDEKTDRRTQYGERHNILIPNQMFSILPISLAQIKAENNSEKRKNEIRQLLHSLYGSKKLTKAIYNNINTIQKWKQFL